LQVKRHRLEFSNFYHRGHKDRRENKSTLRNISYYPFFLAGCLKKNFSKSSNNLSGLSALPGKKITTMVLKLLLPWKIFNFLLTIEIGNFFYQTKRIVYSENVIKKMDFMTNSEYTPKKATKFGVHSEKSNRIRISNVFTFKAFFAQA
jgi:hypothetical protein